MDLERKQREEAGAARSTVLSEGLRVLRLAESLRLSPETIARIKAKLLGEVMDPSSRSGASAQPAAPAEEFPSRYPKVETIRAEDFARSVVHTEPPVPVAPEPTGREGASSRPAPVAQKLAEVVEAELLLRKKIEAEQSWAAVKADAWKIYERFPRPDTAARMVELAFLYGTAAELEDVLVSMNRSSIDYLALIDSQIRSHAIIKLWQAKRFDFLDHFLFRKDLLLRLFPVERFYCLWSLVERGQHEQALRTYKRHEAEIQSAQKQFAAMLQKSDSELSLVLGRCALQSEDEALALRLLESIPPMAPEFPKALDLLLDLRVERDANGYCAYGQKLSRELDWKARISLFDSFLHRIQRVEHTVPKDRAALNALLADPLKWFPETPEAWQTLAELLVQHANLERLLPNIMKTFQDRALQFFRPPYEHALWSPVLDHNFKNPVETWYWRAIAQVHEFAWELGQDEKKLWEARQNFSEALAHHGNALPLTWQKIHRALMQWIGKSDRLDETARVRLLLISKLSGETQELNEEDVTTYLAHVREPSAEILESLETLARDRHQLALEGFILGRKAELFHHTNQTLARTWSIGVQQKRSDLCWRVATLLKVRQVLNPEIDRHWVLSGEKRREFPMHLLGDAHLKKIFASFEGSERRLLEALVTVGPLVPELLAGLHEHLAPLKRARNQSPIELEVQETLNKLSWLPAQAKQFSPHPGGLWQPKPAFLSNMIDGRWPLLFFGLAQRLGVTAWDWQLSLLNQQIETLIPKMTRANENPAAAGKVGRWLRGLTPQQRKAWYELASVSKRFQDDEAQAVIARFLVVLATSIHQDHLTALQSLDRMRAPLRLRWDLENWIVSETYGELRKMLGSHAIGQYADDVFKLPPLTQV